MEKYMTEIYKIMVNWYTNQYMIIRGMIINRVKVRM